MWAIVATSLSPRAVDTPTILKAWNTRPTALEVSTALELAMAHICERKKYHRIAETLVSASVSVRDYTASAQYTLQHINDCDELMEKASMRVAQ